MSSRARRIGIQQFLGLVFAFQASGCGGRALDLGDDSANGPPRSPDGTVNETVPWAVAPNQGSPGVLAIDDSRLYWAETRDTAASSLSILMACKLENCSATVTTYYEWATEGGAAKIATDSMNVYWRSPDGILSCPVAGCPKRTATRLVDGIDPNTSSTETYPFATDDTYLYWAHNGTEILRCELADCSSTHATIASLDTQVLDIVVGSFDLYLITQDAAGFDGDVLALPKNGSSPVRTVAATQHLPTSLAIDANRIYWANDYSQGSILACPLDGCTGDPDVIAAAQPNPMRIVVDDRNAYFVTEQIGTRLGALFECSLAGCGHSPKLLAPRLRTTAWPYGTGIALDTGHVYFTEWAGNVNRIGK